MNRVSVRDRMRRAREDAIVEAATALLAEKGYIAMTMDDLAAAAGVSKATLYQHFRSKEELVVRVALGLIDRAQRHIAALDSSLPAIDRLEAAVRFLLRMRIEMARGIGLSATSMLPVILNDAEYWKRYLQLIEVLMGLADEAKRCGDVDPALPSRLIVQIPMSLLRDVEYGMLVHSGECGAAETVDALVTVFLRGIRPQPKEE